MSLNKILKCALCNKEFKKEELALNPLYGIRDFLRESSTPAKVATQNFVSPSCETHPDQPVLFWCLKDKTTACQTCFECSHNGHSLQSYRKYLQNEVSHMLAVSAPELKNLKDEASNLISKCDEQIANILHGMNEYEKIKKDLKNGSKLIDSSLTRNEENLVNFANDADFDLSLQTITSFLSLNDKLNSFKQLISQKNRKILGFQQMILVTRFYLVQTWSAYEIKGSTSSVMGRNKFHAKCILPRKSLTGNDSVKFQITWTELEDRKVTDEIHFYGHASVVSSKPSQVTSPVAGSFGAKGTNCSSMRAETNVITWGQLWGSNRAFLNKDWTFDVHWDIWFNDPKDYSL